VKAIVQDRYGSADVLQLQDIDPPEMGDSDVLVRVRAAGVDPGVVHTMTGLPLAIRAVTGLRAPRLPVRGMDAAGTVEAVGANVTRLRVGDEVFGSVGLRSRYGTFAEQVAAPADKFVTKPANLTFEQAAAVPVSALTALQGLRDKGKLQAGQRVLVIGAGGGVGTFAVQIAKALDAEVTGVCSTGKVDLVRSLGADEVVDYTRDDFTGAGERYDLVLDCAGNRPLGDVRRVLTERGTLVLVGGEGGGRWLGGTRGFEAMLRSSFSKQTMRMFVAKDRGADLETLKELIESRAVTPALDRAYPLSEAREAVRVIESGHARGKTVLTIS
jgi:NADPH:quinone reductase-like Zn-dependent oxidoreductase